MNAHGIKPLVLAAGAALSMAGAWAVTGEPGTTPPSGSTHDARHAMMGGAMMDMMRSCRSMMGDTSQASALPSLPAGNAKLEAQMHAEMLQKLGEIEAKYADRIQEAR
jgi:hypothetical protein